MRTLNTENRTENVNNPKTISRRGFLKAGLATLATLVIGKEAIDISKKNEGDKLGFDTEPLSDSEFSEIKNKISVAYRNYEPKDMYPEALVRTIRLNGLDDEYQNLWKLDPNRDSYDKDFSFFNLPSVEIGSGTSVLNHESEYPFLGRPILKVKTFSTESGGLSYLGFRLSDIDPRLVEGHKLEDFSQTLSNGEKIIFVNLYNKSNAALDFSKENRSNLGFNLVRVPRSEYQRMSNYKQEIGNEPVLPEIAPSPTQEPSPTVTVKQNENNIDNEINHQVIVKIATELNLIGQSGYIRSINIKEPDEHSYQASSVGNNVRNLPAIEGTSVIDTITGEGAIYPQYGIEISRKYMGVNNSEKVEFWVSDQDIDVNNINRFILIKIEEYKLDNQGNRISNNPEIEWFVNN